MYSSSGFINRYGRGRSSHDYLVPHYNKTFDYGSVVKEAMKILRRGFQPISLQQILVFASEHYRIKCDPDLSNLIQAIVELQNTDFIRSVGNQIFMETRVFKERYKNVFQITMPNQLFDPNFGNRNLSGIPNARNGERFPNMNSLSIAPTAPDFDIHRSKRIPARLRVGSGRFQY